MNDTTTSDDNNERERLAHAYKSERPKFMARLRAAGRTIEEAEDLLHDVYAETIERIPLLEGIQNLQAWINTLFTRRLIDSWRHEQVRKASGETEISEETLCEIIAQAGLDPLEDFVRASLIDALNDALLELPRSQRKVIEAQVFGGMTFREISEATGESIDTLTSRKRYAVQNLSSALRHWISQ